MANLEIRSVSKEFKTGKVLDRISLAADNGEIVAVFGPSGSGKTVLLRLIAGVEQPDEGTILLGGRDVTDRAPETRGVGMAFQNFALFPHMSAFDNVASALTAHKVPRDVIRAKVEKVAALLKIDHVLQHAPRELSNGQKQRTALARALVAEPKILLLDDPLRNVDAKLRYEMRLELPSLLKASGSTVLYVTQDYKEAMALGDRIAVLSDRDFAQIDRPAEIYRTPATLNVASLFGDPTINLMPVEPRASSAGPKIGIGGAELSLPPGYGHMAGKACVLGLRAENILVEDMASPESLPVEVVAVTPLNERTLLLLRTDDGREILASEAGTNEAPRRHGPAFARFDAEAVLLFDPASGRSHRSSIGVRAMSEAALSIKSVDKIYEGRGKGPVHAVKNLDMDVQRGEIVALLGSSGCGKTSTLRMIAGFEEVTHGDIVLEGRRVNQMPPARRKVAMAFEGYSLYPPLTVRDNIAFALKSARTSAKDVQKSVADVAHILEIEPILDRYPSSISGGEQQRASLARALVRQADLYLLGRTHGPA